MRSRQPFRMQTPGAERSVAVASHTFDRVCVGGLTLTGRVASSARRLQNLCRELCLMPRSVGDAGSLVAQEVRRLQSDGSPGRDEAGHQGDS